jgi:hypothetical protein
MRSERKFCVPSQKRKKRAAVKSVSWFLYVLEYVPNIIRSEFRIGPLREPLFHIVFN